ncbi:MAG: hypothetical protein WBD40_15820 [Tepidisphaeraceae bacterium]
MKEGGETAYSGPVEFGRASEEEFNWRPAGSTERDVFHVSQQIEWFSWDKLKISRVQSHGFEHDAQNRAFCVVVRAKPTLRQVLRKFKRLDGQVGDLAVVAVAISETPWYGPYGLSTCVAKKPGSISTSWMPVST